MAKPRYSVTVTFGIGSYIGDWTGEEERMEEQYTFLLQTFDKEAAEKLYQRIARRESAGFEETDRLLTFIGCIGDLEDEEFTQTELNELRRLAAAIREAGEKK
jgi:predicted metal-dependent phosphotriesterase family hydrolase